MKNKIIPFVLLLTTSITQAQTLHWATEATYPPFETSNPSGKIEGFDVDLMNAVCKQMKAKCTIENTSFDSLIPSLKIGKYDAIIGGLAITEKRKKVINFSNSYYKDKVIVVSKEVINKNWWKGKTVGVQSGTVYQSFVNHFHPEAKIKTYQSNMSALLDLKTGRINAVLIDEPVYVAWKKLQSNPPKWQSSQAAINDEQSQALGESGNGIGISKSNPKLLKSINQALDGIKASGELKQIKNKWFKK